MTTMQLRDLLIGDIPLIAVSFPDGCDADDIRRLCAQGLDVAELRIDRFSRADHGHVVAEARRFAAVPTLATIRSTAEGGDWSGTDEERLALFEAVLPEGHGIDIELSSTQILPRMVAAARRADKVVIVSHHDFEATPTPASLVTLAGEAKALGADYVKLSVTATSPADVVALADFTLRHAALGLIVIAMGDHGTLSRIFFPALGSRLTYAWAVPPVVTGQLSFHDTFSMLSRFYPAFAKEKRNSP